MLVNSFLYAKCLEKGKIFPALNKSAPFPIFSRICQKNLTDISAISATFCTSDCLHPELAKMIIFWFRYISFQHLTR